MPEFNYQSGLKKREKELSKIENKLKYFSFFYTKDHHVNLKRISIFAICFILFFYGFRILIINDALTYIYNLISIAVALYMIAFFLVTTRYESDMKLIDDFKKHLEDIKPIHDDKIEQIAQKLMKKR